MISDLFELTRSGRSIGGELPLRQLLRLETPDRRGAVNWRADGLVDRKGRMHFDLNIEAEVVQVCQRCLEPVGCPLSLQRRFFVALTEAEADSVPLDDDETEVVVGSKYFDFSELVEDEIILSLPLAPKHLLCSALGASSVMHDALNGDGDAGTSISVAPFASLAALKSGGKHGG